MKKTHIAYFIFIYSFFFFSCYKKNILPPQSKIYMNTVCTINAFDNGTKDFYEEAFTRLDRIEKIFSPTLIDSELNIVNKNAGIDSVEVSDEFIYVLTTAQKISKLTNGALDITIGPLINLWGINTEGAKVPTKKEIQKAKKLVDYKKIIIKENKIFLPTNGMELNFGAVVKGYAADEIVLILKKHNIKKAIIDLGGNIYVYGKKENKDPWIIGIKNPKDPQGDPLLKLYTTETSIVTSGNYERYFEQNEKRYHHILDTKTGESAESGLSSITIICKKSIIADCLSTAAFVLGDKEFFKIISLLKEEFNTDISYIAIYPDNQWNYFGNIEVKVF